MRLMQGAGAVLSFGILARTLAMAACEMIMRTMAGKARAMLQSRTRKPHAQCCKAQSRCPPFRGLLCGAAFGWDSCDKCGYWDIVKEKIPDIMEAGFTHVWLPPPSQSVADQARRSTCSDCTRMP